MRAQCIICTDYFEKDKDVAAMPCGHTFHHGCLSQWLTSSKSCPHCRKALAPREKPIRRLFFTDPNDSICLQDDSAALSNLLEEHKIALKQKDSEKQTLESQKNALESQLALMVAERQSLEKRLQDEKTGRAALKKELTACRQWEAEARQSAGEADALRAKLRSLEAVEKVVSGCDKEVQAVLASYGDAASSRNPEMHQLIMITTLLRRELDASRQDRRKLRKATIELKQDLALRKQVVAESEKQVASLTAALDRREADLRSSELECAGLRRRLGALSSAIESPAGNPGGSLARRLLCESPAPSAFGRSQKISATAAPSGGSGAAVAPAAPSPAATAARAASDGNATLQLFNDSCFVVDSPPQPAGAHTVPSERPASASAAPLEVKDGQAKQRCNVAAAVGKVLGRIDAYVRSKPLEQPSAEEAQELRNGERGDAQGGGSGVRDVSNIVGLGYDFGAVRKKESDSAFFRKGYNGLGGHGMHISTPTRQQPLVLPAKRRIKKRTIVVQKKKPSLTLTINDYVVID